MAKSMPRRQNRSCEGRKAKDSKMTVTQKNWSKKTYEYMSEEKKLGEVGAMMGSECQPKFLANEKSLKHLKQNYSDLLL